MQGLKQLRPHGHPDRHEGAKQRRELRLGMIGAAALAMLLVAAGVIYVLPIGKHSYTADLSDAQSVKVGDQVRMAGIPVGSVKSLELQHKKVRMTFTVRDEVRLGDQSTLEVRMLTAVGGHYVAVLPAGDKPLGSKTIPADRVRLPYSLVRTLQDAAAPVAQVDGETLRKNFAALQNSLDTSPDALRQMTTAVASFVGILNNQNSEISRALNVMDEYLSTLNDNKALLGTFVRQIGMLETMALNKKAEISEALRVGAGLLSRIAAVEPAWREQLQPIVDKLLEALPQLKDLGARVDEAGTSIGDLRQRLQAAMTPEGPAIDQSAITIAAPSLCVPVPGRGC
ncbi:MCE family protein [Nocardia uniformis]|uniref:MCE family protein n=1 Tax=Nocardia uniformis TaxID=53432 RepID=A0A849C277_9NOCA|nr:MlaD family protein [Nocardia uniformis]NNH72744.1 MCE family protein [Nocardia uniformis]